MDTFRINPSVIHDLIEGQVILLNLDTGNYYQLKDEAVTVWQDIAGGAPMPALTANLGARYGLTPDKAAESIHPFLKDLETEALVTLEPAADASTSELPAPARLSTAFNPPVLLKFTDMQSLLLLDPIHDVGAEGWPLKRNGTDA